MKFGEDIMRKGTQHLTDRDRNILEFVHRYKVANDDLLARKFFGLERRNTNLLRVTRKLIERNFLKRFTFGGRETYLMPTRKGCHAIGQLDRTPKPMTEQSLPAALAMAYYCVRHGVQRFRASEWKRNYPHMHRQGLDASRFYARVEDHVFEDHDPNDEDDYWFKLGVFMVDSGGAAHRIKSKISKFLKERENLELFMDLVDDGLVQITILTGLDGQQRIVNRHLGGDTFCGARVKTALIPELGELLTMK
jgi:hypothetical protein